MPPQMGPPGRADRNARFKEKSKPKDIKKAIKRLFSYIGKDKLKVFKLLMPLYQKKLTDSSKCKIKN